MDFIIEQNNNIELIDTLLLSKTVPRSYLITGDMKSGKSLFSKYIASKLKAPYVNISSLDEIREMTDTAYTSAFDKVYIFDDFEDINFRAQEALLKVLEEPPQGCHMILNAENQSMIKTTILNRVFHIEMENYSIDVLHNYGKSLNIHNYLINGDFYRVFNSIGLLKFIAEGERLVQYLDFLSKFMANINTVTAGNSLKTAQYISLKKDDDKVDLRILFRLIFNELLKYMKNFNYDLTCLLNLVHSYNIYLYNNPYINVENIWVNFVIDYRKRSSKIGFVGVKRTAEA